MLFNFRNHKKPQIVLRLTPLILDVSGTKVRLNLIVSTRINDFFRTLKDLLMASAVLELINLNIDTLKKGSTLIKKSTLII